MADQAPHRRAALAAATAVVVLTLGADVVAVLAGRRTPGESSPSLLALVVVMSAFPGVVGLLVLRRHPLHVIGWLLVALGFFDATLFAGDPYAQYATLVAPGRWPGAGWAELYAADAWPLLYVPLALIGYLFPDGRFLSRRWRRFVLVCLAGQALFVVAAVLGTDHFDPPLSTLRSPSPALPRSVLVPLAFLGLAFVPVFLVGSVVSVRRRFRMAAGVERVQLLWFAAAGFTIPAGLALCWLEPLIWGGTDGRVTVFGVALGGIALPAAIGTAILRHQLFDIELVLSRTLTYGTLTVLVVGVYAGILVGLGALVGDRTGSGLVAVGVVAVLLHPVHARLRRRAEHWVYGDRSDPYAALRRLSGRLEQSLDADEVVATVTSCVAEALRVPRVQLVLARDATTQVPASGSTAQEVVRSRLVHHGEHLGDLVVPVPPGRQLSASDRQMLDDLARQAAVVVRAVHLTLDLQRSRARLVTAQEEERRRLRRDLHDGVGPSLAAIVLKLNVLGNGAHDPQAASLIEQVRAETRGAIAEIRRLVDDLRPPALDEVGLLGAMRQRATSLSGELLVTVDGPSVLPPLPAALEVAVYRIAVEAMTNAARHSGGTHCRATVTVEGGVRLTVTDNGTGPRAVNPSGVGLSSMRERAEELGGACSVTARPDGGTVVSAWIPWEGLRPVAVPAQPEEAVVR